MKVVNLKAFLALPKGTIFTKAPLGCHELLIKGENHSDGDFWYQSLMNGTGEYMDEGLLMDDMGNDINPEDITGNSFDLSVGFEEREVDFDESQLYVVYEQADIMKLMAVLCAAHNDSGVVQKSLKRSAGLDQEISLGNATLAPFGPVTPPTYMTLPTNNDDLMQAFEQASQPGVGHINFLVAGQFERLPILATQWDMQRLGIPYVVMEKMPTPLADFVLEVDMRKSFCSKVMVYASDKADVACLALELSAKGYHVSVKYQGHVLQTWDNGAATSPRKTISWIHGVASKEDDDLSKF